MTTAATHMCVLCMRYCNGITADILLHYLMKFHLEITKDKEMATFLYVLSDHPSYISWTYLSEESVVLLASHCPDFHIRKTCPCNVYPLKPHFYIEKLGYAGVYLFFLFLLQNIDCGYSLEPPRRGGSNVYPQSMF